MWSNNVQMMKSIVENGGIDIKGIFHPVDASYLTEICHHLRKNKYDIYIGKDIKKIEYIGIYVESGTYLIYNEMLPNPHPNLNPYSIFVPTSNLCNKASMATELCIDKDKLCLARNRHLTIIESAMKELINGRMAIFEGESTFHDKIYTYNIYKFLLPVELFVNSVLGMESLKSILVKCL